MVYILRAFKATEDGFQSPPQIIYKWDKDHVFNFDLSSRKEWRKFLSKMKIDGKLLPRKSKYGHRVVYSVINWGGGKGKTSMFPGYNPDGSRPKVRNEGYLL